MESLGRRLKNLREKTRFTQEEIAKMLGVRRLVITNIENESRKITAEELYFFSKIYGLSMEELYTGEDKEKYGTEKVQYETLPLAVSWEDIKACIPSEKINEYHGYVNKNIISSYLIGEQEDIYDCISIEEYKKLSFEEQLLYDYFEWDDSQGWFKYFKIIIEHVNWQLFEWKDVNFLKEIDEVRIIVFIF